MSTVQLIAGSIFHFAPTSASSTPPVTPTAPPTSTGLDFETTVAPWVILGTVQDSTVSPQVDRKELTACTPGLRTRVKSVVTKATVSIKGTLGEINDTIRQLAFLEDGAGGIGSGVAQKEGWLRYEIFNEQNESVETRVSYGALSIDGDLSLNEEFVKPKFTFEVYKNSANTTVLAGA